jgi:hypothetical protein
MLSHSLWNRLFIQYHFLYGVRFYIFVKFESTNIVSLSLRFCRILFFPILVYYGPQIRRLTQNGFISHWQRQIRRERRRQFAGKTMLGAQANGQLRHDSGWPGCRPQSLDRVAAEPSPLESVACQDYRSERRHCCHCFRRCAESAR